MYSKTAALALLFALLSATSAQEYDLYLREAEADPNFKSFIGGVGKDLKAYGSGFGQGFSRRDAEAEAGFNNIVKDVMRAEGRMGGSFVKGLLGRDIEDELLAREAEADPNFKNFIKGVGKDFKAYGQGFGQGVSKRDAEAEAGFNNVVQGIMKAEGRMGGSFVKGLLGRDAEADYDDFELYAREPGIKQWFQKNGPTIEKGIGSAEAQFIKHLRREADAEAEADYDELELYTREPGIKQWFQKNGPTIEKGIGSAEAQFIKHLRRDAEAEADFDDVYAREASDFDGYDLFSRDAKFLGPISTFPKPVNHLPVFDNKIPKMVARDAEADLDDEFELYVREAARAKTGGAKPSGGSGGKSGIGSKYFKGAGTAAINAVPGALQGIGSIMQGANGQQQPQQKRDAFADPDIFDYEY